MGGCFAKGAVSKAESVRSPPQDIVESASSWDVTEEQPIDVGAEERNLLGHLGAATVMDLMPMEAVQRRRFVVDTETDQNLNRVNSFASKTVRLEGDAYVPEDECIGFACKKGLKPEVPNQDSFLICRVDGLYSIYSVFDGHGRKGHDISHFVKEQLTKILVNQKDILRDPIMALTQAFDTTQRLIEQATSMQRIDANRSGTTASVVLHDLRKKMLYLAHVGDSRCVLAKRDTHARNPDREWQAVDLTEDHKPNLPAEKARIESLGGQVIFDGGYNYRVYAKGKRYPGLNMSRAMGDLKGSHDAGISAVPDICDRAIASSMDRVEVWSGSERHRMVSPSASFGCSPMADRAFHASESCSSPDHRDPRSSRTIGDGVGFEAAEVTSATSIKSASSCAPSMSSQLIDVTTDKFVLICSDGVWEFMSSQEAVLIVAAFRPQEAMIAAETLATCAWDRWMQHMHGEVVDDITVLVIHFDKTGAFRGRGGTGVGAVAASPLGMEAQTAVARDMALIEDANEVGPP